MSEDAVTDLTRGVYRRLYSGFTKGQRINKLTLQAEAWFWRILATVDDFGNGDADPELCHAMTAGRRKVTPKQISGWLREMKAVGLIEFYQAKGEPYLHVVGFEASQPAGKNGRRIMRFPVPGESGVIQEIPDAVSASDSENTNDTKNDTDIAPPFAGAEFMTALVEFDQHRKQIRHKVTPLARQKIYAELAGWGEEKATRALNLAVKNGWRGVFDPDSRNGGNGYQPSSKASRSQDAVARVLAEARRNG